MELSNLSHFATPNAQQLHQHPSMGCSLVAQEVDEENEALQNRRFRECGGDVSWGVFFKLDPKKGGIA